MDARSSNYSELNLTKSDILKNENLMKFWKRTERSVGRQQFTQNIDKFVIGDDDMDSVIAT